MKHILTAGLLFAVLCVVAFPCQHVPCPTMSKTLDANEGWLENKVECSGNDAMFGGQQNDLTALPEYVLLTPYELFRRSSIWRHAQAAQTNGFHYVESSKAFCHDKRPDVSVTIRRKSMSFVKEDEGASNEAIDYSEQLSSASLAISIICGEDQSTSSRYDLRDDALSYVASMRDLSTNDIARLVAYLKEPDESMDEKYVVALKNEVKKLVQRHVGEN